MAAISAGYTATPPLSTLMRCYYRGTSSRNSPGEQFPRGRKLVQGSMETELANSGSTSRFVNCSRFRHISWSFWNNGGGEGGWWVQRYLDLLLKKKRSSKAIYHSTEQKSSSQVRKKKKKNYQHITHIILRQWNSLSRSVVEAENLHQL